MHNLREVCVACDWKEIATIQFNTLNAFLSYHLINAIKMFAHIFGNLFFFSQFLFNFYSQWIEKFFAGVFFVAVN